MPKGIPTPTDDLKIAQPGAAAEAGQTPESPKTVLEEQRQTLEAVFQSSRGFTELQAIVADFIVHEKKAERPPKADEIGQILRDNLIIRDLSPAQMEALEAKSALVKMLRGQTGRELRRELRGFAAHREKARPGMVASECLQHQEEMERFLGLLIAVPTPVAGALSTPVSETLKTLLKNPEALYERVVTESNAVHFLSGQKKDGALPVALRRGDDLGRPEYAQTETEFTCDPLGIISARKAKLSDPRLQKPVDKWIPLVLPAFKHAQEALLPAMLDSLGFIPEELYTKKVFREKVSFQDLAHAHDLLRRCQVKDLTGEEEEYGRQRVLHERTKLLTHLFLSGIAETVKNPAERQVIVDVNGLWINIGPDNQNGIHAHIPFAYVTDALGSYWVEHAWLSESDWREARLRRAANNNDVMEQETLEERKVREFCGALEHQEGELSAPGIALESYQSTEKEKPECPSDDHALAAAAIAVEPDSVIRAAVGGARVPLSVIDYYLRHANTWKEDPRNPGKYAIEKTIETLEIAEEIQSVIADERKLGGSADEIQSPDYEQASARRSYDLTKTAKKSYALRQRILNDARFYDVARIAGAVLEHGIPESSPENECIVFRGRFAGKGGQGHHFLEIMNGHRIVRVLLAPEKHLNKKQREAFEKIPLLERADYEQMEAFNMTYIHFCEKISWVMPGVLEVLSWPEAKEAVDEVQVIVLTEFPENYVEAQQKSARLLEAKEWMETQKTPTIRDELRSAAREYHDFIQELLRQYANKFFNQSNIQETLKALTIDIQRETVSFDDRFLESMPKKAEKPWAFDEALSRSGQSVKVVHSGAQKGIPYAMEAKAIRALGLLPDRPLISVLGGCRHGDKEMGMRLSETLMESADRHHANLAPPGTQSGLGADMGRVWLEYQTRAEHLPAEEKARCFAVSPGGETYYPGNPSLTKDTEGEVYAVAPFDSILTPFDAGWNWTGERKANAPYAQHVEYMEAIYQRLTGEAPRVTVVGNGGLFTIMETEAALKNHAPIILTEGTGRFADLAITMLKKHTEAIPEERWTETVLNAINHDLAEEHREKVLKDFGAEADDEKVTEDQRLYRRHFQRFLKQVQGETWMASSIENLAENIDRLLQK